MSLDINKNREELSIVCGLISRFATQNDGSYIFYFGIQGISNWDIGNHQNFITV